MNFNFKLLIVFFVICTQVLWADVKMNSVFSDHMVVQRETNIPIWGWADPGEKIKIVGSWGETATTIANEDGTWKTTLRTPKAGGPFEIIITGKNKIILNDVLSGEVWLCTGQSNMDFSLSQLLKDSRNPKYQPVVEKLRNEVASANDNWLRHIEVSRNTSIYEKQTDFKGQWISAVHNDVKNITATGYFFAKQLREKLNVPVGLVECSWGGTRIQPWISEQAYLTNKNLKEYFENSRAETASISRRMDSVNYKDTNYEKKLTNWKQKGSRGRKPKPTPHPDNDNKIPSTLYNGMLHTVIPYAIKGAIWYQGESNAGFMQSQYQEFFSTMIKGWRSDWGQGDFPFYWVQLAACKRGDKESDNNWAVVNDQLRRTLTLSNTGMAVLHDIGEAKDIHPHNKMDAGKRLSYWALDKDYNVDVEVVSGPLYHSFKIKGNKIQIKFSEVGTGLITANKHLTDKAVEVDEPLRWFEIQDAKGDWYKAQAKIVSKTKIEVSNPKVSSPKNARYAWSGNPDGANLYNKQGLPAAVFSTEK